MIAQRLTPRDHLRIYLLRKLAGDRIVVMNTRIIGPVTMEPHDPRGGTMICVNVQLVSEEEPVR